MLKISNKDNSTTKNKINGKILKDFIGINNKEEKLFHFFNKKRIYIEIFNIEVNCSNEYYELLSKYNIIPYKRLNKNIEYIVFKNGHLKTKKYAFINNIPMVNEFWIYDKINNDIYKDDKEYIIQTNFTEIILSEKINNDNKIKKSSNKKSEIKNYDVEIEEQYDSEYSKYIDETRINKNNNNINSYFKIGREKRIYNACNPNLKKESNINIINQNKKLNNDIKALCDKKNGKKKAKSKPNGLRNQTLIELQDNNIKLKNIDKSLFNSNYKKQNIESNNSSNNIIYIISYQLPDEEIKVLETLKLFRYKGNLEILNDNNLKIYDEIEYIIVDYNNLKNNLEFFKFVLDKKFIIEFITFLLEFINIL